MSDWKSRLSSVLSAPVKPVAAAVAPAPVAVPAGVPMPAHLPTHASRTVRLLGRRSAAVTRLAVTPDAQTLVAAHADGQLRFLRAGSGLLLHSLALPAAAQALTISADGRRLAVAVPVAGLNTRTPHCEVRLINLRHGTLEHTLEIPAPAVQTLCFDPAGRVLAVAAGPAVSLWDAWGGHHQRALRGHEHTVCCLAFSPDGQSVISGDEGGCLQHWQVATGQSQAQWHQADTALSSLSFSGDGAWLAWGDRAGRVWVQPWPATSFGAAQALDGPALPVRALRFTPDHQALWVVQAADVGVAPLRSLPRGQMRVWRMASARFEAGHALGELAATCWVASPCARWLALGDTCGAVRLVATQDGGALRQFPHETLATTSLALSPDQQWLASGRQDGQVSVWQPQKGELLREMQVHRAPVSSLGFSADGRWWASGAQDGTVLLWGRGKPYPLQVRPGLRSLSFCPHNRWLALAGGSGAVQLLPLREPKVKEVPVVFEGRTGIVALQFSAHGQLLVWACADASITSWDPASAQLRSTQALPLHGLQGFALSDDLRWLAASSPAGELLLWDFNAARPVWLHPLPTSAGPVQLLFNAQASVLHACAQDGSQSDWDVASGQCLGQCPGVTVQHSCLGLARPIKDLYAEPLAGDSIQLLHAPH